MTLDEFKTKLDEEKKWKKEHWFLGAFIDTYELFRYRISNKIENAYLEAKWGLQRMFRGYDDTAFWGLDSYITEIAIPVLKWYLENKSGTPVDLTEKEWKEKMEKMLLAFQTLHNEDYMLEDWDTLSYEESSKRVREGLQEFANYFTALWD